MQDSNRNLHIVAFDVPFPANYGGVIDIFYRIKALHALGVRITLHCYKYGREESLELNKYCETVHYYNRKTFKNPIYSKLPYIVNSRNSVELLENLKINVSPILFEGLHCCYYLAHPDLKNRFKIVRTHNIEHDYYANLEKVENNFFKKYFFRVESERLRKFESRLKHANLVAAISPSDYKYFSKKFPKVMYLPAFHPNEEMRSVNGKGDFVFYHGNLGVGENDEAAKYLVKNVAPNLKYPLIIAGANPSNELRKLIEANKSISLLENLNSQEMLEYVKNAQVNVLPTFQNTGIKLKLINSLFLGRHCVANKLMTQNTGLENLCHMANNPLQFQKQINSLMKQPFGLDQIEKRKQQLLQQFDNKTNAAKLLAQII